MYSPSKEHVALAARVGKWSVACEYFLGPGQMVAATETVTSFGPFWIESHFEADMLGMPFRGRATMGFEPVAKRWVSTWVDTLSPFLYHFESRVNGDQPDVAVLEMHGRARHPHTQELTDYRTREETRDDGSRLFEMWFRDGDTEVALARYTYTRDQ